MKFLNLKLLSLAFLSTALLNCSKSSESDTPSNSGGNPSGNEEAKPILDKSDCESGLFKTDVRGAWYTRFEAKDSTFDLTFDISTNEIVIQNKCRFPKLTLTASVRSPVQITSTVLETYVNQTDNKVYNQNGIKANCEVSVRAMKMKYQLYKSCLILSVPEEEDLILKSY